MKIGTISQQNRPHRMKVPKYLSCDEVPRQIVSSAMIRLLSEWRPSTSVSQRLAASENLLSSDNSPAFQRWVRTSEHQKSLQGRKTCTCVRTLLSSLKGLKDYYETFFPALKRWGIIKNPCQKAGNGSSERPVVDHLYRRA